MTSKFRPRILLVLDDERDLSGPSIVLLRLFSVLHKRGLAELHVIAQRSASIVAAMDASGLAHTLHDFPITYSRENLLLAASRPSTREQKLQTILRVVKDFRADLVHLAVHPLGPFIAPALAELSVPCFVHFHANHAYPRITPYRHLFKRCLSRPGVQAIAVSDWIKGNIAAMGVPQNKITRIYNGLEPPELKPDKLVTEGREPVFAFIAQIRPEKGLPHFIRALQRAALHLGERHPVPITGAIVGHSFDTEHLSACKALAKECEKESDGRVSYRFLGRSPNPFDTLDVITAVVLPSLFDDPLPTVAIESVCRGLPTIGYARGGLLEILGEGRGLLVPSNDIKALADSLLTTIEREARDTRAVVRTAALSLFSMDTMINTYLSLTQEMLDAGAN